MKHVERKTGWIIRVFALVCVLALPLVVLLGLSYEPGEIHAAGAETAVLEEGSTAFDDGGGAIFKDYDRISKDYLEGIATGRTLDEYYSRRQYPGSPPFIPHKVEEEKDAYVDCLACHAKGGWTEELKRNTPRTPHPEHTYCRQCHLRMNVDGLFVASDWKSVRPPKLGRSHLPGGPPPIPHQLQMRGDCIACHVGPGAVEGIRVDHPSRGNCRQCHVPDTIAGLFERASEK